MSVYDEAVSYINDFGWSLVQLPPKSKGDESMQKGWNSQENVIDSIAKAKVWIDNPACNMGLVHEYSNTVAFDIDDEECTRIIFNSLGINYDELLEGAPRISGKPGRDKAIFKIPEGTGQLTFGKLSWPARKEGEKPITVWELRTGKLQDVLPPSIHPDTGSPYTWKRHPKDGIPDIPRQLLSIWKEWDNKFAIQMYNLCPWGEKKEFPHPKPIKHTSVVNLDIIGKYNSHIDIRDILDRNGYVKVASRYKYKYSTTGIPGVYIDPDNKCYSHHASDPLCDGYSHRPFSAVCILEHNNDVTKAVHAAAIELKTINIDLDEDLTIHGKSIIDSWGLSGIVKHASPGCITDLNGIPEYVLSIPGILQHAVDYYNNTAPKRQPQFAVNSAIAIGSVVMGQRFVTDWNNYSSLYIMNVAKSSAGKEHSKTVIEEILIKAGLEKLIGPSGYASSGGVYSCLLAQPCHIVVSDEFGRQLESTNKSKDMNKTGSFTTMMEAYGRLHSVLRPPGYSTMTVRTKSKSDDYEPPRVIHHPSPTIVCMTTPSTLYENLNGDYISNGFLSRIIVVEAVYGRQLSRRALPGEVHHDLIEWCKMCASTNDADGNLKDLYGPLNPPIPKLVPFSDESINMLDKYEEDLIRLQDDNENIGLAEMFGRNRENAHRLSLIVAISCGSDVILPKHTKWAIDYIRYYSEQTVIKIGGRVSETEFEGVAKSVLQIIKDGGARGATESELKQKSRKYRAMKPKEKREIIEMIMEDYDIIPATINTGRGPKRNAYIINPDISSE